MFLRRSSRWSHRAWPTSTASENPVLRVNCRPRRRARRAHPRPVRPLHPRGTQTKIDCPGTDKYSCMCALISTAVLAPYCYPGTAVRNKCTAICGRLHKLQAEDVVSKSDPMMMWQVAQAQARNIYAQNPYSCTSTAVQCTAYSLQL